MPSRSMPIYRSSGPQLFICWADPTIHTGDGELTDAGYLVVVQGVHASGRQDLIVAIFLGAPMQVLDFFYAIK